MEPWLWALVGLLTLALFILLIKLYLLRKSARELQEAFAERLTTDTNTLIDISSGDSRMRALARDMNLQLRKLRAQRHRFVQGDLELKEAITNISHDLRTPLTAICGYLDLLRQEEKSATAARYLAVIEDRTETLKQLTEELFRYSIVTSTVGDTPREEVVLNHALEESLSGYYAALKGCHITPSISMPEEPVVRLLNKNALARIFGNILSNAIKYSDGDLVITLTVDGVITFSNHASTLNDVQVARLFDRYYTVETAQNSTGLGLSIARVLTEQMGGSITADYRDGILSIRLEFP